ncbi:MAG: YbhB/YbcL family Raf kinase inhibitor-like protein [Candidatus Omnitrophica bacterium]|nr:YbhB/YbcL family Raf kinase inhibitor-like protein [Candidatus Omnitrophota bacterium]
MKKLSLAIFIITLVFGSSAGVYCIEEHKQGGGEMKLSSPEFENNKFIPSRFTCEGEDVNPALVIENIPSDAKSLALIVDDPDAPMGTWVHWVVYDIPVASRIDEDSIPGKQGINDFRRTDYGGPCPPSGTHRYFFKIYALDKELALKEGVSKKALEKAMEGHILDKVELVGLYKKGAR